MGSCDTGALASTIELPGASLQQKQRIVAIGASAGGLEPCEQFFDNAPVDAGLIYVVIQHLSPDFRSLMDELLARHSSMPIHRVEDGMKLEPNTIYLNRPRQILSVENGHFIAKQEENEDAIRLPIDDFFHSISREYSDDAIGVVLSGSGSDGSSGARAIKASGGLVFVQSVNEAKFDSMPRSVMSKVSVDGVGAAGDLPELIRKHVSGEAIKLRKTDTQKASAADPVNAILELMQDRFGTNFSFYKTETIGRRLTRRKDLSGFANLQDYYDALLKDRHQVELLYNDLLIEVTSFFRDKAAFDLVEKDVIPDICAHMSKNHQVRIWVPGCASGEEAYSLAILVAEYARKNGVTFNLKILATDIHRRSLTAASSGIFAAEHLAKLDNDVRERYFNRERDVYQVRQILRRAVVFSPHDLLNDPPFTRMDLVSCRNVMIYLTEEAQQKLLTLFHFSLRKDGYLFLGPSETTGKLSREFQQVSQRWRVFKKSRDVRLIDAAPLLTTRQSDYESTKMLSSGNSVKRRIDAAIEAERSDEKAIIATALNQLLEDYAPPGFLIDRSGRLIHIFGDSRKFLQFNVGAFTNNIAELLDEPIAEAAGGMVDRLRHGILVEHARDVVAKMGGGDASMLRLTLRPILDDMKRQADYAVLSIEETGTTVPPITDIEPDNVDNKILSSYANRISELERLLATTEESLQATIEEMETSNEELQATNEELMSSNEELQSTNEELHSVNEELYTVSAEHELKIEELSELTSDMDHLLKSTEIGTIFLDEELHVRRFTPAAAHTFNLIAQDVGRPFAHVTAQFDTVDVQQIVRRVQETGKQIDSEITANDRAYIMRVLPYVIEPETTGGIVITMIDVDELERARVQIAQMERLQDEVVKDIGQALFRWTKKDGIVTYCNDRFAQVCGATITEIVDTRLAEILSPSSFKGIKSAIKEMAPGSFRPLKFEHTGPDGQTLYFSGLIRAISDSKDRITGYQFTGRDETQEVRYISALEEVLEVDRSNDFSVKGPAHQIKDDMDRVEKLLEIVQSYLSAEHLLVTIGGPDEDPAPLELPAVSLPEKHVPQSAYDALFRIVEKDAKKAEAASISLKSQRKRTVNRSLLTDLNASRAIIAPIIAKNLVIGRVAFSVSDSEATRDFTELEMSLARVVIRWVGYIWERSRSFELLQRTSNQLRVVIEQSRTRIWCKDDQNKILWLNQAALDTMGGITREQAEGGDTYELFPEMAAKYHEDDLEVINSGKPKLGIIEAYTPKGGNQGWVSTDKIPYVNKDDGERTLLVMATDITELKELQEEVATLTASLSEQRGLYKEIYRHTPTMMLTTDKDGLIQDVNDLLTDTGGYAREDMIGKSFDSFFVPVETDPITEFIEQASDDQQIVQSRLFACADGQKMSVELAGLDDNPLDGEMRRLWVMQDVTARNAALLALKEKNIELEQLNDGLAQFAYAASHDLQEPLRKIRQYGDLLTEDYREKLDDDATYYVDVMTSSAERMSSLVRNLLQFSSASQVDLAPQSVPLRNLVDAAIGEYKALIDEAKAEVEIGPLPSVECDANLIQIVVSNIISNALKYRAPRRKPKFEISASRPSMESDDPIVLTFRDNGIGFDASEAERVFDPFVRLVSKSQVPGSGIGLAICRTICERHGWNLTATSQKGKYTQFDIKIPKEKTK